MMMEDTMTNFKDVVKSRVDPMEELNQSWRISFAEALQD